MQTQQHAKLSASGSERWLNCLGSVAMEQSYPNTSSTYADEGTRAHELAEMKLRKPSIDLSDLTDDVEMIHYVSEYIDYVESLRTMVCDVYIETRVDFSHIVPQGFGTCDCAIVDGNHLHIIDLKYGKGVVVTAENNSQLLLYASGFINTLKLNVDKISLHIVQPRASNFSEYNLTIEELRQFENYAKERANLAMQPNAPLTAGEKQCKWCKAKADCPALKKLTEDTILSDLDLFALPELPKLTDDDKRNILKNKDLIIDFFNTVEKEVFNKLASGGEFEGYKLIEGRSNRKWRDGVDDVLVSHLGNKAYKQSLITITEAEKLLKKNIVNELTIKPTGQPKLVSITHKSPAITVVDTSSLFDFHDDV